MSDIRSIDVKQFIGRQIGNVTILRELGKGTMGVVFVGFQKSLKRQVAVKMLPKAIGHNEAARTQFRDEAELVASLSHPNIIPVFEMDETEDFYYQTMQLVDGVDLNTMIKERQRHPVPTQRVLPVDRTVDFIFQILDGLGCAHEMDVIHQDIKPANILVEKRSQRPLIADFGIARTMQAEFTARDIIVGTPLYMAPEQASGQPTDGRADIYSVGVMMFEMLAGILPLRDKSAEQLMMRKLTDPANVFSATPSQTSRLITPQLEQILQKALAANPDKRYTDCRAMREDLLPLHNPNLSIDRSYSRDIY